MTAYISMHIIYAKQKAKVPVIFPVTCNGKAEFSSAITPVFSVTVLQKSFWFGAQISFYY